MEIVGNSLGSRVRQDIAITVTIRDIDGNPANPTEVNFIVTPPVGPVQLYTLDLPNVQVITAGTKFRCVFDASVPGFWKVETEAVNSAGDVVAVDRATFYVAP